MRCTTPFASRRIALQERCRPLREWPAVDTRLVKQFLDFADKSTRLNGKLVWLVQTLFDEVLHKPAFVDVLNLCFAQIGARNAYAHSATVLCQHELDIRFANN